VVAGKQPDPGRGDPGRFRRRETCLLQVLKQRLHARQRQPSTNPDLGADEPTHHGSIELADPGPLVLHPATEVPLRDQRADRGRRRIAATEQPVAIPPYRRPNGPSCQYGPFILLTSCRSTPRRSSNDSERPDAMGPAPPCRKPANRFNQLRTLHHRDQRPRRQRLKGP
jgi:hypothetical protein